MADDRIGSTPHYAISAASVAEKVQGRKSTWRRPRNAVLASLAATAALVPVNLALPAASASAAAAQRPLSSNLNPYTVSESRSAYASLPAPSVVSGWYGGAAGFGVANGKFEDWLGQPLGMVGVWADRTAEEQKQVSGLYGYENWKGPIDIATGGLVAGETFRAAANGAYDARWRAAAKRIAQVRAGKGATFVRPFHEFNGNWCAWSVTASNVADFRRAYIRYVQILRAEMPSVYIVWSPNYGDHSRVGVEAYYPGNAYVDVIGPDYYSDFDAETGAVKGYSSWIGKQKVWRNGAPLGIEAWRLWAKAKGKPFALPEWGLKPGPRGSDLPGWISAVNTWASANRNTKTWRTGDRLTGAGGKVLYTVYFNVNNDGPGNTLYGYGANPKAAAMYRSLDWGR